MIRIFIPHTGQECLRRPLFSLLNHNDHKRSKVAERDSSTISENTPIKEGKSLLFKMCILDAVMIGKPVCCGKTNNIDVFDNMLKYFVV